MKESERFLRHVRFALACAAGERGDPDRVAAKWLRWLRCAAPRGEGLEPGWGGETVYLPVDREVMLARHREIVRLRTEEGLTYQAIADRVNLSASRVGAICRRLGLEPSK